MDTMTLDQALFGVPVSLTLSRAMFGNMETPDSRYDVETVKPPHLTIMQKPLGLTKHG